MISRHALPTRHRWCARNCVNLLAVDASTPDNRSIVFVTIHNPLQPASLRGVRRRMPWRENWWYQHGSYSKALMWVWCPSSLSVSLQTENSRCCWIYVNLKICFFTFSHISPPECWWRCRMFAQNVPFFVFAAGPCLVECVFGLFMLFSVSTRKF